VVTFCIAGSGPGRAGFWVDDYAFHAAPGQEPAGAHVTTASAMADRRSDGRIRGIDTFACDATLK